MSDYDQDGKDKILDAINDAEVVGDEKSKQRSPKQADILISFATDTDLYHTADGTAFADIEIDGHRETWKVKSGSFKDWLVSRYFWATNSAPGSEALNAAINVYLAKAKFAGPVRDVYVRVGEREGNLYIDLCDDKWRAIEVTPEGWQIVDRPPVRFRRASGMKPLPGPTAGGSIAAVRQFLNVQSDAEFSLLVAWLVTALRSRGPYPVLILSGEQGSAKSTAAAVMRDLVDPSAARLRSLSRNEHDLFIAANNSHVIAFDNISGLPPWLADAFCRLATGGGFATRRLYTDQDEELFEAKKPVILNGIEDIATKGDLIDRALLIQLEPIPESRRLTEAELWRRFEAERPAILGALLDAMVVGLKALPTIKLNELPRMADFAIWATACESGWPAPVAFVSAYRQNRLDAVGNVIDADPLAGALRGFIEKREAWTGTATALLRELDGTVSERVAKGRDWPQGARAFSGQLRRLLPALRKVGVDIGFRREGRSSSRLINVKRVEQSSQPSAPSAPSAASVSSASSSGDNKIIEFEDLRLQSAADGTNNSSRIRRSTVGTNALNIQDEAIADDADANLRPEAVTPKAGWTDRV